MNPLVIGHRGASRQQPENTLPAFEAAMAGGADMVEFDVRRTRDGVCVVVHDASVGGRSVSRWDSADLTTNHRRQIIRLRGRKVGGVIPTLEAVISLCAGQVNLDVELKEAGYEAEVLNLLLRRFTPDQFVITSFLDEAVAASKRLHPEISAGLLLRRPSRYTRQTEVATSRLFTRLRDCQADFVAPWHLLATDRFLSAAADHSLPAVVWTVNRRGRMEQFFADDRIMGVISDVPDLALKVRAEVR